jgi:hypothetical protein
MSISEVTKNKKKNIELTRLNKTQNIPSHEHGGKVDGNKILGDKRGQDTARL